VGGKSKLARIILPWKFRNLNIKFQEIERKVVIMLFQEKMFLKVINGSRCSKSSRWVQDVNKTS